MVEAPVTVVQPRVFVAKSFTQWSALGIGPLTMLGGLDGLGFINTKYANASDDFPGNVFCYFDNESGQSTFT